MYGCAVTLHSMCVCVCSLFCGQPCTGGTAAVQPNVLAYLTGECIPNQCSHTHQVPLFFSTGYTAENSNQMVQHLQAFTASDSDKYFKCILDAKWRYVETTYIINVVILYIHIYSVYFYIFFIYLYWTLNAICNKCWILYIHTYILCISNILIVSLIKIYFLF